MFFVINKNKIYTYAVTICMVVLLFVLSVSMLNNEENTITTSTNVEENVSNCITNNMQNDNNIINCIQNNIISSNTIM